MKITIHRAERMTLEEFADKYRLEMVVRERKGDGWGHGKFYAHFRNCEEMSVPPGILIGTYGNGPTPQAAIIEYAEEISNKRVVVNAMGPKRKEIEVPELGVPSMPYLDA